MIKEQCCGNCRFFLPRDSSADSNLCRRYPPIFDYNNEEWVYAAVYPSWWCGEHKPKEEERT